MTSRKAFEAAGEVCGPRWSTPEYLDPGPCNRVMCGWCVQSMIAVGCEPAIARVQCIVCVLIARRVRVCETRGGAKGGRV